MGKWTGTVSVVAVLAAIGVWSTSTLVTKAAINEQTATAASSFPTALPADFIPFAEQTGYISAINAEISQYAVSNPMVPPSKLSSRLSVNN